jgi:hypothetical protein
MSRKKRAVRRSQPRSSIRREALPSCVLPVIHARVDNLAKRFNVSRSWVVAQIVADYLDIPFTARFDKD